MKVGLVLGGGGVRGLAHIGVIKVLKKHQIPIDLITGTSMGGAIGGLVAAGIDIEEIEDFVLKTPSYRIVDIGLGKGGLFGGNKIYMMLLEFFEQKGLGDLEIEQLHIPFRTVAVDLKKGKSVVFNQGSLRLAIRSTTSVPGFFAPVKHEDKVLVDGGILNNLPTDIAREEGAEFVIAVDVERAHEERAPRTMIDVLNRSLSIMMVEIRRHKLHFADLVIKPEIGHLQAFDITKIKQCIMAGESAAEKALENFGALYDNLKNMEM
ncbi:patatin-like phospholipase family protein [Priestia flexa]|uniref:patatin-like phospholipase family protein n=1 Tax=Priestia flexa TaxID=86664 RepID=UPI001EF6AD96|nr:patatin-like phospholipase family protein [Priestia flexa]MCG7314804.1 patatin-like phospholipase family protein [Priestia flexa]